MDAETLEGKRLWSVGLQWEPEEAPGPGDYWYVMEDDEQVWYACDPKGNIGCLDQHEIVQHDDGTITVSPSILFTVPGQPEKEWHGYLERGVWRSA